MRLCIIGSYPPIKDGESIYTSNLIKALLKYHSDDLESINVLTYDDTSQNNDYKIIREEIPNKGHEKIHIFRLYDSANRFAKQMSPIFILNKIAVLKPNVIHFEVAQTPRGRFGGLMGEPLLLLFLFLRLKRLKVFVTLHSIWLPSQVKERISEITKNKLFKKIIYQYFKLFTKCLCFFPNKTFLLLNSDDSKIYQDFRLSYKISSKKLGKEIHGLWFSNDNDGSKMGDKAQKTGEYVAYENNQIINSSRPLLFCPGFIKPSKGYEYVIMAMKDVLDRFPTTSLLIYGALAPGTIHKNEKEYVDNLKKLVVKNALEKNVDVKVIFLTNEQLNENIPRSSIIVLPYSNVVGASGVLHLAMSLKKPVILSGSGPLFEELKNIVPVVTPRDSKALAKKIIEMLENTSYTLGVVKNYDQYLISHDWETLSKKLFIEYRRGLQ